MVSTVNLPDTKDSNLARLCKSQLANSHINITSALAALVALAIALIRLANRLRTNMYQTPSIKQQLYFKYNVILVLIV